MIQNNKRGRFKTRFIKKKRKGHEEDEKKWNEEEKVQACEKGG